MAQNPDPQTSALDGFFLKLGTVLSLTKDALLADFIGDFPSYVPPDMASAETLSDAFATATAPLSDFIEYVFRRLGYDLKNFDKNKELYDLVKALLATTDSLGANIAALASDDFSWQEEAKELVKKAQGEKGEKVHIDTDTLFKEVTVDGEKALFRMDDGKGNYASISVGDLGDGGKIGKIINIVVDIFDLLKKFRDLEWEKIGKEYTEFGEFLEDSYFNEEFAERLFDHILVVLLSKAREVFDEEIRAMAKEIDQFTDDIENALRQAQDAIGKTADQIKKEAEALRSQIEAVKNQIEAEAIALYKKVYGAAEDAFDEAKARAEGIYDQVSGELLAQYRMLENELTALMKTSLGPFGKLGDVLDRIYHVLDFFGLIQKRTIEIARFIPEKTLVDTIEAFDAQKFDNLVNQANLLSDVTGNLNLESLQKSAMDAVAQLKESIPTVEINVIRWSRLEQLFTKPEDYFHEVFPIHDYDDAEALLVRLAGLVRSFNPDIFDFSSISNILNELFVRLRKAAAEAEKSANETIKALKAKIEALEKFILEIKRVLECYAIEFKTQFKEAFKNVGDGAKSILDDLKKEVQTAIDTVKKEAQKTGKQFIQDTNVLWQDFSKMTGLDDATKDFLFNLFAKPLEELIAEKAAEHKLFASVDPKQWTDPVRNSFSTLGSGATDLAAQYIKVLKEIQGRIDSALSEKQWEARFKRMAADLEKEFVKQTAAIPDSVDGWKSFGKDTITTLIQGGTPTNPFSSFDFTAYISLISDHVKNLIPTDLDLYYVKFRNITTAGIEGIINNTVGIKNAVEGSATDIGLTAEKRAEAVKLFVADVYAGYWPKLKDNFYKMVIRPVLTLVEKTVKEWAKELLKEIVKKVVKAVKRINIDREAIEEAVKDAQEIARVAGNAVDTAASVAEQILLLKAETEEKGVDTWSDALKLAVKIYGLIPEDVKDFVRDIINLPKIDVDINLPEYKLDIDNKFLAVKLYELKPTRTGGGDAQAARSFSLQLLAFVGDRENKSGLYLYPYIKGELEADFNLGTKHALQLNATASLNEGFEKPQTKKTEDGDAENALKDGIGLFITEAEDFSFDAELLANADAVKAWLEIYFSRGHFNESGKLTEVGDWVIYDSEVFSVTAEDYPQKAFVGYAGGFDAGYRGEIRKLKFGLDLRKLNSFFEALVSDKIELSLDKLALGYSYRNGLDVEGSVSVRIPINKTIDLKAAKLSGPAIEIGFPDLRGLSFGLSLSSLALNMGCVHFSLADLGFSLKSNLFDSHWHFNDFNLSPSLKLPDGIGLSIDLEGAVKGTGALKWNKEKGEVVGAAELVVVDLFGASALFILNMKETDGVKFSFMGAISVYFTPGIQLGMGFSLTAVGGALGLFRRIDTDRMQQAVHDGTLSTVMFVKDLDKNLDTVLANMTSYYPISKENFFFGVMAQISWAEKVKVELGLFIQAPDPVVIMIAGGLHFNVADSLDKLLSINANFLGIIDLSKGLSFDASLYDSYIVGIQFYGDIALRIYWAGDTKGFLLSAGGFHPQYTPEAGFNVANMKRLGMKLNIGPVKFSMEEYFAVTSNTVQFGSDTRLQVGWKEFGISGYMYYNVLFQFRPFAFMFDAGIGVAVKCGSWTLMSIALSLEVSGPRPWHFKGTASFWFLFAKVEVGIEETWGKKQEVSEQSRIAVFPLYSDEFNRKDNWTVISTDLSDKLVAIAPYEGEELMMNSSDTLYFSQETVPLDQDLERFGEAIPSLTKIELKSMNVGAKKIDKPGVTESSFAPSLFKNMTDKEKLSSVSYQKMHSGFLVKDEKDMDNGPKTEVSINPDPQTERIDMDIWEKAAKNCASATRKDTGETGKSTVRIANVSEKEASRVYKPSYRRTAEGFNRYIKALDGSMGNNLASLKEELNEQIEA